MGAPDRFSRTLRKDQVEGVAPFELRPLDGGTRAPGAARMSARGNAATSEQNGYEAGRAQGHADAMRAVQQERATDLKRIEALLAHFQASLQDVTAKAADAVLDLALDVAGQILRREVQAHRDAALPAVREALALVIEAHAHPTVRLAPVDFAVVREALRADGMYQGCRFIADAQVQPGGCRVESPHGEVDGSLATRWRRVVQALGCDAPAPTIDVVEPEHHAPASGEGTP
jgi:flagellar assembly protein FliH